MKRRILSLITLIFIFALAVVPFTMVRSSAAETKSYTFANFTAGTQYAKNEVHKLDDDITVVTNDCHFTSELRIYSSSTYNGYVIIKSTSKTISSISVNAGNKVDTLVIYGSNDDGSTWTTAGEISVTATSYKDYPLTLSTAYKWLKIDVKGSNQVRLKSMKLTLEASACAHANTTDTTVDATCTTNGSVTTKCNDCGVEVSKTTIPASGHNWDGGVPHAPTCTEDGYIVTTCIACGETKTTAGDSATGHDYSNGNICGNCGEVVGAPPVASFVLPTGEATIDSITGSDITLPEAPTLSLTYDKNYTFVGWATSTVDNSTEAPELYSAGESVVLYEDTVFYAVFSYVEINNSPNYVEKNINDIISSDIVVITITNSSGVYAMSNDKGTGNAPSAVKLTVTNGVITSDVADNIKWNISNSNGTLTIYPNGTTATWLYCTSTNNGTRVGTNANKTFVIDATSGYLKHVGTSRYIGVYNNSDWRCYTSYTTDNIKNQTLKFFVLESAEATYYTTAIQGSACTHESTTTTTEKDATCTENGISKVVCNTCGETVATNTITASGHNYGAPVTTKNATCAETGILTYTCTACNDTKTEDIPLVDHTLVDNVCIVCKEKITDYSGRYYIATIRSSGNYWYMTNNLGSASTKRYQAIDSGLKTLPAAITNPDSACIFVIENNGDGTYCIYAEGVDGDNYLGWESGNSGLLVSKEKALKVTITANNNGTYLLTIGTRSLALNEQTGNNYFAFYENTQKKDLALIPVVGNEFTGASLNVGADLSIRYHVTLLDDENIDDYVVKFTMNGESVTVKGIYDAETGKYVFTFTGIAPQCLGDTIDAQLIKGETVVDEHNGYSVRNYVIGALALYSDNENLTRLLSDLIYYGAAAQRYLEYKLDNIVSDELPGLLAPSENTPDETDKNKKIETVEGYDKTNAYFSAAGVRFSHDNKIYVKVITSDVENVKIMLNGVKLSLTATENENEYIAYSHSISALKFDEAVTFSLYYNEAEAQTLTYTINSYAFDKIDSATTGELAIALYRYGKSACVYNESK